jgi:hypothetical protein
VLEQVLPRHLSTPTSNERAEGGSFSTKAAALCAFAVLQPSGSDRNFQTRCHCDGWLCRKHALDGFLPTKSVSLRRLGRYRRCKAYRAGSNRLR